MNSEELERSLRAEFEHYLKGVLSGLRQDVSEFQRRFESELEKHKSQVNEAIRSLSERFDPDIKFDKAFTESVTEHLRLARDEGAELAAVAFGEAEKLRLETAPPPQPEIVPAKYDRLRDAITEISSKQSQAAILKSLVEHAAEYTPRGAFFIVKNEFLVGWKVFGRDGERDDASVRELHFPVSAGTIAGCSVTESKTIEGRPGKFGENGLFLDPLGFRQPAKMFAVPLTARGRAVAVLYADVDEPGDEVNIEALETLVRVAGLTVELQAASQAAKIAREPVQTARTETEQKPAETQPQGDLAPPQHQSDRTEESGREVPEYTGSVTVEDRSFDSEAEAEAAYGANAPAEAEATYFEPATDEEPATAASQTEHSFESLEPVQSEHSFDSHISSTIPEPGYSSHEVVRNGSSYQPSVQTASTGVAQTGTGRLSERNVDLPIEVSESERRLHNDARRFARLLVSEIKLYNEQKVNEGREAGDLYERLREAIDRSREMYDKRVKPEVAQKFDYFHYELVNGLAEGNDAKLGGGYPGASV